MQKTISIRSILEKEMEQRNFNISQFSKFSGINRGTLSQAINGNPPKLPSISELDQIAVISGYAREELYRLYIEECFAERTPHWKRLGNFLYRCVELNWIVMIEEVMNRLLEDSSQSQILFETVENWYEQGHREILIPFYHYVTVIEKYRNSDRLAISHYRIFRLSQSGNFESNLHAAIAFEPYRNELPTGYRLDGLLKLANIYFNQHMWKKVEQFADELRELATNVYENRLHMKVNLDGEKGLETERHLVVYYGQGYLLKGIALEKQEFYEEALGYVKHYKDLRWFNGLNRQGIIEVEKLSCFARANFLAIHIMKGNMKYLNDYTNFIRDNPNELLPALAVLVGSANKYNLIITDMIDEFLETLEKMKEEIQIKDEYYQISSSIERYIGLYKKLAIYFFNNNMYNKGINSILQSLKFIVKVRSKDEIFSCVALFELHRNYSNEDQLAEYILIMKEVMKIEEAYSHASIDYNSN